MASLRRRSRKNGSEYYAVLYRLNGKQTSTSFEDFSSANRFRELATKFGPENALLAVRVDTERRGVGVDPQEGRRGVLDFDDDHRADRAVGVVQIGAAEPHRRVLAEVADMRRTVGGAQGVPAVAGALDGFGGSGGQCGDISHGVGHNTASLRDVRDRAYSCCSVLRVVA